MHLLAHSLSAIPFIGDYPYIALGAVAPDLTFIVNEIKFRKSPYSNWQAWAIVNLKEKHCIAYRIAHSALIVIPICLIFDWYEFLIGWFIHIALDLPTHWGLMQQRPFYPFAWKWRWVLRRYK
jgi:hypothetical protein